ncbi:MAG: hypothetical protein RIB03_09305 [Henriciella sp.]|uniref:hypothetical protein n=1 Tax=Henriciella sp. TaxID=1968823 RepID=UPI0026373477|nr:hypothetical protein [Henriciella sp.]
MTGQTLQAMSMAAIVIAAIVLARAAYVMALYKTWTLHELFGFDDGGWETESMKQNRRDFWRNS